MLEVKKLSIELNGFPVVNNSSFVIRQGKVTALIGESGSGKSMTVAAILRMLPLGGSASGSIIYKDTNLLTTPDEEMGVLRKVAFFTIMQDASNSFNPNVKMGRQLYALSAARVGDYHKEFKRKMTSILEKLRLATGILEQYPFELSGGMLQRCMIACALYVQPKLLIADEPTSALDKIVQKEFLELLRMLNENGTTVLLITHDLDVVAHIADELIIMQEGKVVEKGTVAEVFASPEHAYTKRLVDSRF
ncbi:ABC transporter ATP-binding protein [Sporosarcina oncorhynchi]|uniref:ABC transporter ATP-binding protein n=1 Tax=Sporosarcina oncorhynchi TaxID=3056444 RepID=A0ABZ0L5H2_9BACL|nr:ABC transporter ATP-binding protein [Sporosarcina sp. T2O-4]WOV87434.1 ABC transporter ATP-binding protein [Sporosarcina sp. T2O-4]